MASRRCYLRWKRKGVDTSSMSPQSGASWSSQRPPSMQIGMIDVSIRGVLHGIAAVLPKMEAQGRGHIINVSSVGGFVVQPTAAVYADRDDRRQHSGRPAWHRGGAT